MTNLLLRNNFLQDLFDFRRDFDQIFNQIVIGKPWTQEQMVPTKTFKFTPAVESYVDKETKKYFLRVSLPGVEPKDVQILTQGNTLTITGERKFTPTPKHVELLEEEITYGLFEKTVVLPEGVSIEKLNAEYHYGVLEITAPVSASALPRQIPIKTVPMSKQIAA